LVICLGAATRLAEYVQAQPKQYRAEVTLGAVSATDDPQGPLTTPPGVSPPDVDHLRRALKRFVGTICQTPPAHSAVHVAGRRAYQLARQGEAVELAAREVTVHAIELLHYDWPVVRIDVTCGRGTYIRSLARDLGAALGPFRIEQAVAAEELDLPADVIDPLAGLGGMGRLVVDDAQAALLGTGRPIMAGTGTAGGEVAVVDGAGRLLAIASVDTDGQTRPVKVFPPADSGEAACESRC
jgi:tRNA pseudouridine55 synthase